VHNVTVQGGRVRSRLILQKDRARRRMLFDRRMLRLIFYMTCVTGVPPGDQIKCYPEARGVDASR
jgi:hypothetical protein